MIKKDLEAPLQIEEVMEFTPLYRWQHWIRAFSTLVLIITGFYIADPFITPISDSEPTNFMYALFRSWHIIFGFVATAVIILKTYLFVFGSYYKSERDSIRDCFYPKIWIQQIGYYLFMTKHPEKLHGVYNPLQTAAYFLFYMMMFLLILTGFVLYVHVYHEGIGGLIYDSMRYVEVLMGGLSMVREIHHIAMWGVIIFVGIHIYLVIFNAVFGKNGSMDAIFSGMKWHKKH